MHFISGLPRSGSTLLAAILRQNPAMQAGMTSPVGSIYGQMLRTLSRSNEAAVFLTSEQKHDLLRCIFDAYYKQAKPVTFDTNRAWPARIDGLAKLFPDCKLICCVRELGWVMDSVEKLIRKHPFDLSGIFGFDPGLTVYNRFNQIANSGMVGWSLDALREAYAGPEAARMLFVDYEALAKNPARTIARIYDFIREPLFDHNFNWVEFEAPDFDLPLGTPGLHTVRGPVKWVERQTILPKDLFERGAKDAFWRDPGFKGNAILP